MSERLRVLHIDNDALSRSVVRAMLGFSDVELTETASATVGGEMIRGGGYDLALLDLRMNDQDGLELLRALRGDPGNAATAIAIVTGDARTEVTDACLAAGACKVLHKPFRMTELAALVEHVGAEANAVLAA